MNTQELRILVTFGGTSEKIDQVRKITNLSTGRLGSLIADAFAGAGARVTCLCGEGAVLPSLPMERIYTIDSVRSLGDMLERLLAEHPYHCVVHAMAVSDYALRGVTTADDLAASIANALRDQREMPQGDRLAAIVRGILLQGGTLERDKKISSSLENMVLLMEKTPKVIGHIKELQPDAILVGFKLLADAPESELASAAKGLFARSGCDYVLANDLSGIDGDRHKAMLLDRTGGCRRLHTKQEIAETIAACVLRDKRRNWE